MLKLNCGSGGRPLSGWINIDSDRSGAPDLLVDLAAGIPLADSSVDYIHSEDFVSCLPSVSAVETFLHEAHRVLKPSGVMRLLVPSLDRLVEAYQQRPEWLMQHWNRAVGLPLNPPTAGHLVNLALRLNPGFMFDLATMQLLLGRCRFRMRQVDYNESAHDALRGLDDRQPDQSVSMYLECDPY